MVLASQIASGMTIAIAKKMYRVDQAAKISGAAKAAAAVKVKLYDLETNEPLEKIFKPTQEIEEVQLEEQKLEFLYLEEDSCVFLNTSTLELILVPYAVIGSKLNYLKEGIEVKALCCKNFAFSIELPQFLELMVSSIESQETSSRFGQGARVVKLETGAEIDVPPFVDVGDIIKVDPRSEEYIQRV